MLSIETKLLVSGGGAVGVGPASIMVGNLVAGKRMAQAAGRELGVLEDQELIRKVPLPHRAPPSALCIVTVESL